MVDEEFLVWSVVDGFYGQCAQWSAFHLVGGRCFAFLLFGGQFLFSRMVGGHVIINIWLVVGGLWSVVCGRWLVVGSGFVLRHHFTPP